MIRSTLGEPHRSVIRSDAGLKAVSGRHTSQAPGVLEAGHALFRRECSFREIASVAIINGVPGVGPEGGRGGRARGWT